MTADQTIEEKKRPEKVCLSMGTAGLEDGYCPPAEGRRSRRAAETRKRLFRTAMALFAEKGFTNVTVEEITEAADVGKGTFFNYFPSKDHVLGVMAEIQLGKVHEAAKRASGKQDTRAVLHRMAVGLIEEPGRSPQLARAVISSFLASEVVRNLLQEQLAVGRAMMAEIVARGQIRGEIDGALKKDSVARQFQQALMGMILLWSLHGEPSLAVWLEETFEHFWRSVAARSSEKEQ